MRSTTAHTLPLADHRRVRSTAGLWADSAGTSTRRRCLLRCYERDGAATHADFTKDGTSAPAAGCASSCASACASAAQSAGACAREGTLAACQHDSVRVCVKSMFNAECAVAILQRGLAAAEASVPSIGMQAGAHQLSVLDDGVDGDAEWHDPAADSPFQRRRFSDMLTSIESTLKASGFDKRGSSRDASGNAVWQRRAVPSYGVDSIPSLLQSSIATAVPRQRPRSGAAGSMRPRDAASQARRLGGVAQEGRPKTAGGTEAAGSALTGRRRPPTTDDIALSDGRLAPTVPAPDTDASPMVGSASGAASRLRNAAEQRLNTYRSVRSSCKQRESSVPQFAAVTAFVCATLMCQDPEELRKLKERLSSFHLKRSPTTQSFLRKNKSSPNREVGVRGLSATCVPDAVQVGSGSSHASALQLVPASKSEPVSTPVHVCGCRS